jgi:hypothetical protein
MAWAIIARAVGIHGDLGAARRALQHAREVFDSVELADGNTAYEFTLGQLHFYASDALTRLGDTAAARDEQDAALATFGPGERLDPTLVRLDRAACMIHDGDVSGGSTFATAALLDLPEPHRPAIVLRRACAVAAAVPVHHRGLAAVRGLHEVLALAPAPVQTLSSEDAS